MAIKFTDLLESLRGRVARMTALVQQIVDQSVEAIVNLDVNLANDTVQFDNRIDEEEVFVEKQAIDLLARYQPAACDLRLITTIIKVNGDFERIADCAVNIAQRVPLLASMGDYLVSTDLRLMANTAVATLRDTVNAFNLSDLSLAEQVLKADDVLDALYHQIITESLSSLESEHRANRDLSTIMVAKNIERIGDHCTNIAEDIVYVQSGRIIRHLHAV
ncbi:MAG: PhoU family transcriptional regulator [Phycisphaerales bacterium]|nr:PhoU family transcriptional regulator [Phycisphaerales bacterium]